MRPYFVMTIDVDPPLRSIPSFIIERGALSLLKFLDTHRIKATFFIPSVVAANFPKIMEGIVKGGHEVSCHGLKHDPSEGILDVDKQISMIKEATEIIQSATGLRPVGYRAPLFRHNRNCWIALKKNGYLYDSSVVSSPFYGDHRIFLPAKPFRLPVYETKESCGLLEIPVSVNPFLPFPLGGAPMRIFGLRWSKIALKMNFLSQTPVVLFTHPKDVVPRTGGRGWHSCLNTANCLRMLDEIIEYAKQHGARFLTARELAGLVEEEFLGNR